MLRERALNLNEDAERKLLPVAGQPLKDIIPFMRDTGLRNVRELFPRVWSTSIGNGMRSSFLTARPRKANDGFHSAIAHGKFSSSAVRIAPKVGCSSRDTRESASEQRW